MFLHETNTAECSYGEIELIKANTKVGDIIVVIM